MDFYEDSDENEYDLVPTLPNQKVFCLIFAYAWHYHCAVAKFSQLSIESLRQLEKGACKELESECNKDEDFVQMFKLMGTIRPLGLRQSSCRFDIQFPTRSHLKVFITRLIMKRRLQLGMGDTDLHSQTCTTIISSTDSCGENVVSHACKSILPAQEHEAEIVSDMTRGGKTFKYNRPGRHGNGGFSQYAKNILSPKRAAAVKVLSNSPQKQQQKQSGGSQRKYPPSRDQDVAVLDQEVVISSWIDELQFSMKAYDIVSMMRHRDDLSCQSMFNEKFQVHPDADAIRIHFNPRLRNKRISCLLRDPASGKLDEKNTIRGNVPTNHKDGTSEVDIPKGFKIIGVRGFKSNLDQTVLHVSDFLIWEPMPGWLDISPEGQAKRDADTLLNLQRAHLLSGGSWNTIKGQQKNFLQLNQERIRYQQLDVAKQKLQHQQMFEKKARQTHGLFVVRNHNAPPKKMSKQKLRDLDERRSMFTSFASLVALEKSNAQRSENPASLTMYRPKSPAKNPGIFGSKRASMPAVSKVYTRFSSDFRISEQEEISQARLSTTSHIQSSRKTGSRNLFHRTTVSAAMINIDAQPPSANIRPRNLCVPAASVNLLQYGQQQQKTNSRRNKHSKMGSFAQPVPISQSQATLPSLSHN